MPGPRTPGPRTPGPTRRRLCDAARVLVPAAALLATAVLAGCSGAPPGDDGQSGAPGSTAQPSPDPVAPGATPYERRGAYAVDETVTIGTTRADLDVPGTLYHLDYSSAGVVVAVLDPGADPDLDRAPRSYHLVRPDGRIRDLGLRLDGVDATTDEDTSRLAWVTGGGRRWTVHVLDVVSGQEDRARVRGRGDGASPEVVLDGDDAYVGLRRPIRVDWRTGEVWPAPGLRLYRDEVSDGLTIRVDDGDDDRDRVRLVDATTGETVRSFDAGLGSQVSFSPDGRLLAVVGTTPSNGPKSLAPTTLYDLATDAVLGLDVDDDSRWRWTPDGGRFLLRADRLQLCAAGSQRCREVPAAPGDGRWAMPRETLFY